MNRTMVERFFDKFGTEVEPGDDEVSSLYEVSKEEKLFFAEWKRDVAQPVSRAFIIRCRAGTNGMGPLDAATVVLRPTTLLAFHLGACEPVTAGKKRVGAKWTIDITEVAYRDIVALQSHRTGVTTADAQATLLF